MSGRQHAAAKGAAKPRTSTDASSGAPLLPLGGKTSMRVRDDLVSYWSGGEWGERPKLLKVQGGSPRVLSAFKPPPPSGAKKAEPRRRSAVVDGLKHVDETRGSHPSLLLVPPAGWRCFSARHIALLWRLLVPTQCPLLSL